MDKLRLLIVDDEFIIRDALSKMIDYEAYGYELVGSAKNGMEALNLLNDEYPDVVITDIRMPVLSGLELIERAQGMDNTIDFIVLSGYDEFEYARQAMRYGVRHYLLKPTSKEELIESLTAIRQDIAARREKEDSHQGEQNRELLSFYQQAFLMEGLETRSAFPDVFHKYSHILQAGEKTKILCVLSDLKNIADTDFPQQLMHFLQANESIADFPLMAVRDKIFFLSPAAMLSMQAALEERLYKVLSGHSCCRGLTVEFLRFEEEKALFRKLLEQLAPYSDILLVFREKKTFIRNSLYSPGKLRNVLERLNPLDAEEDFAEICREIFPDAMNLQTAKTLAVSLYTGLAESDAAYESRVMLGYQRIVSCTDLAALRDVFSQLLLLPHSQRRELSPVQQLKYYVTRNLQDENLSISVSNSSGKRESVFRNT